MFRQSGSPVLTSRSFDQRPSVLPMLVASLFIFVFLVMPGIAAADRLRVAAERLSSKDLPEAGNPLRVRAIIQNSKQTNLRARVFAVIDGRVVDSVPTFSILNDRGQAIYQFDLFSPLIDMSYQFFVYGADGQVFASERADVARQCFPRIQVAANDGEPTPLLKRAFDLEQESRAYDIAVEAVLDFKGKVGQ